MKQEEKLKQLKSQTLQNWEESHLPSYKQSEKNVVLNCGWGRLLLGQTFTDNQKLAQEILKEENGKRDIAFYVRDPHVLISLNPQEFFLNPSHTYRLWLDKYRVKTDPPEGFYVRRINHDRDIQKINQIYRKLGMVCLDEDFFQIKKRKRTFSLLVAESSASQEILGVIMGIDHVYGFGDPEKGSSIWSLAVDPQATFPGIGLSLVHHLIALYQSRERDFTDLSVIHHNTQAIKLYEKLGFKKIPVFSVKRKNAINEPLFTNPIPEENLNNNTQAILKECRKRGINIEIISPKHSYVRLSLGGRSVECYGAITEMTNAVSHQLILHKFRNNPSKKQKQIYPHHVQALIINQKVVAVAKVTPPHIIGDGKNTIQALVEKLSRRRITNTHGESLIPIDAATSRVLTSQGYALDHIPEKDQSITVRNTYKFIEGAVTTNITPDFSPQIQAKLEHIARELDTPIINFSLITHLDKPDADFKIINAHCTPQFTVYQPEPVTEHFIDFLFPGSRK
jgi:ribosomal protein S18 acetylase RimI-like enzyme